MASANRCNNRAARFSWNGRINDARVFPQAVTETATNPSTLIQRVIHPGPCVFGYPDLRQRGNITCPALNSNSTPNPKLSHSRPFLLFPEERSGVLKHVIWIAPAVSAKLFLMGGVCRENCGIEWETNLPRRMMEGFWVQP
jgi:hypothetical protein